MRLILEIVLILASLCFWSHEVQQAGVFEPPLQSLFFKSLLIS